MSDVACIMYELFSMTPPIYVPRPGVKISSGPAAHRKVDFWGLVANFIEFPMCIISIIVSIIIGKCLFITYS